MICIQWPLRWSSIFPTSREHRNLVHQLKRPFKTLTPPSGVFFQAQVIRVPTVICHLRSILLNELLVIFYSFLWDFKGPPLREKWYPGPPKNKPLHSHGLLDQIKTENMTDIRIISKEKTQDQEKLIFCSFFLCSFPQTTWLMREVLSCVMFNLLPCSKYISL